MDKSGTTRENLLKKGTDPKRKGKEEELEGLSASGEVKAEPPLELPSLPQQGAEESPSKLFRVQLGSPPLRLGSL